MKKKRWCKCLRADGFAAGPPVANVCFISFSVPSSLLLAMVVVVNGGGGGGSGGAHSIATCNAHHLNKFNYPRCCCQRWWLRVAVTKKRMAKGLNGAEREGGGTRTLFFCCFSWFIVVASAFRRIKCSTNHNVNMNKFNGKYALKFRWIKLMKALKQEFSRLRRGVIAGKNK